MPISDAELAQLADRIDRLSHRLQELMDATTPPSPAELNALAAEASDIGPRVADWSESNELPLARVAVRFVTCAGVLNILLGNLPYAVSILTLVAQRCLAVQQALRDAGESDDSPLMTEFRLSAVNAGADAANVCMDLGAFDDAQRLLDDATERAQAGVDALTAFGLANSRTSLAVRAGRVTTAYLYAEEALRWARDVGGGVLVSATINLALACANVGLPERAKELYEQALAHPDRAYSDDLAARLGIGVLTAHDDVRAAIPLLVDVTNDAMDAGDRDAFVRGALAVGASALTLEDMDEARIWFQSALDACVDTATRATLYVLQAMTWRESDPDAATKLLAQARDTADSGDTRVIIDYVALTEFGASPAEMLAAALVVDTWRIELPGGPMRDVWQQSGARDGMVQVLTASAVDDSLLHAAICAHVAAISLPPEPDGHYLPRPAAVGVGDADPLADVAAQATEVYGLSIREEALRVRALSPPEGALDLIVVERDGLWMCWRGVGQIGTHAVPDEVVAPVLAEFAVAAEGFLTDRGALSRPDEEDALMRALGALLLPEALLAELDRAAVGGVRPTLRVRADGEAALVPWALLATDAGRLIDRANVVTLAPYGLRGEGGFGPGASGAERAPSAAALAAIIDPRVPGFADDSALGPVLNATGARRLDDYVREIGRAGGVAAGSGGGPVGGRGDRIVGRTDQDRTWLRSDAVAEAGRLLFVGHASTALLDDGISREAALHLSCSSDAEGRARERGAHRPFAASDLLYGGVRLPPRVAFVGCASGADARTRDGIGLTHAALAVGAEVVAALRWPVPTGQWFDDIDAGGMVDPLADCAIAVDQAMQAADCVAALGDWQRARLEAWRRDGAVRDSPLLWGAVHVTVCG